MRSSALARDDMLTHGVLKRLLRYDPETGAFTYAAKPCRNIRVGDEAGCVNLCGYVQIRINNKFYYGHRLAFLWMTGTWPLHQVDHINGRRSDNRWRNLREATRAENRQNVAKSSNKTSRFLGVCWWDQRHKWLAQIKVCGRKKHLGLFTTEEEAHSAYLVAKATMHLFNPSVREASP